jgi:hypothetical protein
MSEDVGSVAVIGGSSESAKEVVAAPDVQAVEPVVTPPEDDKDTDFARKLSLLTRKEREILKMKREFSEKQKQYEEFENLVKMAKEKPLEYLSKGNLSYDDITNYILTQPDPKPEDKYAALEAQINQIKKGFETEKEQAERAEAQRVEQAFKDKIVSTVNSNPDEFEFVKLHGKMALDLTYQTIEDVYKKTGQLIPINDALKDVEQYLENETKTMLQSSKKAKAFFSIPEIPNEKQKGIGTDSRNVTTLTHDMTTVATSAPKDLSYLPEEDSKRAVTSWLQAQIDAKKNASR